MRARPIPAQEPAEWAAVRLALGRHQQRREQGIPTLGVLVGSPADAVEIWQDWARSTGRRVSVRQDPGDEAVGEPGEAVLYVCRSSVEVGENRLPAPGPAEIVGRLCRRFDAAGGAGANAPFALAVELAEADAFLRDEPYSRARTLFAEGRVILPTAAERAANRAAHSDQGKAVARQAPSLAGCALRPETAASFAAAATAWRAVEAAPAGGEEIDRARSAAERFLFDLLGDLPETAGLFELNVRLGFCFGPMPAEVDLLAAGLRLAVEIDGFHHFRDPGRYRRDRRKDALLQRQGFLVLRFLAEDVVVRLEEILEEVRTAVAFRRATRT